MRAIAVTPGVKGSARLIEAPDPKAGPGQVRVKVLRVGIDGTDIEIDRAEYGEAPPGETALIIGHESFGQVESVGPGVSGVAPGDYVVAMVRRPDGCGPCKAGESDMCLTGQYTERGIKGAHGFLSEYYVEAPEYLITLSPALHEVGVMLEPLTVVEKGIRHAWALQGRMKAWAPRRALVLGAGPIGLMAAMLMRLRGIETIVYGRDPSDVLERRIGAIGARYIAKLDTRGETAHDLPQLPGEFGAFDFILEATGAAPVAIAAMRIIGLNGALCLTSVTGGDYMAEINAAGLNLDLVLGNRVIFGSVNANRIDFENGAKDLAAAHARWPGWLEALITRRVPMARFRETFERKPGDVKVVVEVAAA